MFSTTSPLIFHSDTISLCNEPIQLSGPPGYDHYSWNTGSISEKITVNSPGRYIVKSNLNSGDAVEDTFVVKNNLALTTRSLVGCADDQVLLNNGVVENVNGKVIEFFSDRARTNQLNASVKISTRHSKQGSFNSPTDYKKFIDEIVSHPPTDGFGDTYLPEYKFVSNNIVFHGPKNDIAYKYTIRFFAKTAGNYRFRTSFDFGNGGAIFLDGNVAAFNNANMWWNNNWNLPGQTLQWSNNLKVGMHEILVYGLEDCCDGGGSAEYKGPDDIEFTAFSTSAYVKDAGTYYVTLHDPISGCSANDSINVTRYPIPQIKVTNPAPACKPASIDLTLAPVTAGSDASLKFTYFNNAGLRNPVSNPAAITDSGLYYIVGQAENGCQSLPAELLVNLYSTPVVSFTTIKTNGCTNQAVMFRNTTPVNAAFRLHWSFGTGNNADTSNEINPNFTYQTAGNYPVTLTVFSPGGCFASYTNAIQVFDRPLMSISGPSKICIEENVQFSGSNSGTAILSHTWNFGNGTQSFETQPPLLQYSAAGDYIIQLIGNSPYCADTAVKIIKVNPGPDIKLPFQEHGICLGGSIALSANDGIKYEWSPAIGLNNTEVANPVATPNIDTWYRVKVTALNGCVGKDSIKIIVHQPINVTTNSNERICAGNELHLQANGAIRYEWTPAEALINPNSASPIAKPGESINYQVIGFSKEDCFSDTAFVMVEVVQLPIVKAGNDTNITAGKAVQLLIQSSNDVIKYNWTPAIGLSCTNCAEPYANPLNGTLYTITVQNEFGCLATDNIEINLNCSIDNVKIPNAFTPNNDGQNDFFYPIGKGIRSINYMRIYNRWGRLVFERKNFSINDRSSGWDGKINGILQPSQLFVYAIQLVCDKGQLIDLKGNIILIE